VSTLSRRGGVIVLVALALAAGLFSIRVGAELTAAAAPPPAPPVSMTRLLSDLKAEQARSAALQGQLDELDSLTSQLSDAVAATQGDIAADGLSAGELRSRLKAAQAKLATMTRLLADAQKRLAALNAAASKPSSGSSGSTSSTTKPTPTPATAAPTPTPVATRTPRPTETPEWHGTPEPQH
jgi:septal ring factor EnvC (AmiA/AmiB activator)